MFAKIYARPYGDFGLETSDGCIKIFKTLDGARRHAWKKGCCIIAENI
jgi:hypothetical protein